MRPILLIMWTAFQSFILWHNNNSNYNTNNNLYTGSSLHNEWYSVRPCKFHAMDSAFQIMDSGFLTVELGFWIKKPKILNSTRKNFRILDSTSKNFPDSGIRIPLHGVTYMWNHGIFLRQFRSFHLVLSFWINTCICYHNSVNRLGLLLSHKVIFKI